MSVHLAMPACCCGLSSWMWCGDNSGKAKQQTHYSSKYIHLGCARDWNIIHFPHFIAPAVELGLPGPHSAIPAELAPGTARQRTRQNFTFPWIKPSRLGLLRVTHPWFSPLLSSHPVGFLTNTPLGNVLARRARFLTKIPQSLSSTVFLPYLKD